MNSSRIPYKCEEAEAIAIVADNYYQAASVIRPNDKVKALKMIKIAEKLRKQAKLLHVEYCVKLNCRKKVAYRRYRTKLALDNPSPDV